MDLLLVRHAEPERIEAGTVEGPANPPLTPAGFEQAERLAAWLAHERIDAVLSSPQLRAIETAQPIARMHAIKVEVVDAIAEYDLRSGHYIPTDELARLDDGRWQAMIDGRWEELGGDAPEVFQARIAAAFDEIVARFPGKRVVTVCHGGVINTVIAQTIGLDRLLWFNPGYASLHRVVASRNGIRTLVSLNDTAHLEAIRTPRPDHRTDAGRRSP